MKKLFNTILCIILCAFTLLCSAALAEPEFDLNASGYITGVKMESEAETLRIPAAVGETDVCGIAEDVFNDYHDLKYVLMDHSRLEDNIKNKAMDFSSAPNLEYIFVNTEITEEVHKKFLKKSENGSNVEILQYIDFSDKGIMNASIAYENGMVVLSFPNIAPYSGASHYRITRTVRDSDIPDVFDSKSDFSNFSMINGRVSFSDSDVDPGQEYFYSIVVTEPFGSVSIPYTTSISIPASEPEEDPQPDPGDGTNKPDEDLQPETGDGKNEPDEDLQPETGDGTNKPDEDIQPETGDGTNDPVEHLPPETGDDADLVLWAALIFISSMGLMLLHRRKEAYHSR